MSAEMPLRERIAAVLAQHDPLHAGDHGGDLPAAYAVEADEIADVLGGVAADADQCAGVVWTVIARSVGTDVAGPVAAYADVGADVAALVEDAAADPPQALDEELELDEALADPLAVAILAVLIEHDPAPPRDPDEEAEAGLRDQDEELRYQDAALELVDVIASAPASAEVERATARVLEARFERVERARLAHAAAELAELAPLAELLRASLPEHELPHVAWRPSDPLAAGILAVLERHDPEGIVAAGEDHAYRSEAEELAELLREGDASGAQCGVAAWTVLRRFAATDERTPIARYAPVGADVAQLVVLHGELVDRDPSLVEPQMPAVEDLLAGEPLALRVLELIVEHDPLGFAAGGGAELEYLGDARLLAVLVADGPDRSECQVLAWKVLAEPNCGPFGGAVGRYRALGAALARLVRTR
jgi:hypothetical protein